jgi:hypothetical protein
MPWHHIIWTDLAREKIAANGVTEEEVEYVVLTARKAGRSRSTGRPIYIGWTSTGRHLVIPFRWLDDHRLTIEIITAYAP